MDGHLYFCKQVASEGGQTRLVVHNPPVANNPPSAAFSQTVSGRTVTADAAASRDLDGTLVEYVWDFGAEPRLRAAGRATPAK